MPAAKKTSEHSEEKPKKRVVRRKAHHTDGVTSKADHDLDGLSLSSVDKKAISERVDAITRKAAPLTAHPADQEMPSSFPEVASESAVQHARDIHQNTYAAPGPSPISTPLPKAMPVMPKYDASAPQPVMESAQPASAVRVTPTPKDTNFLAPAHDTFNLKHNDSDYQEEGSGWVKKAIYTLGILIALAAIALVALTFYAPQILNKITNKDTAVTDQQGTDSVDTTDDNQDAVVPASTNHSMNVVNANADIQRYLQSSISTKYQDIKLSFDTAGVTATQSGVTADTLYFVTAAKADASKVQSQLASVGLNVKIEEDPALKTDFVLALAKTIKPDLSKLTAAVYNATGKAGLAKSYCTALTNYKVASCNPLNSADSAKGLVVYTNQSTLLLSIKRTPEFATASFVPAANGQVEDIRVVAGK